MRLTEPRLCPINPAYYNLEMIPGRFSKSFGILRPSRFQAESRFIRLFRSIAGFFAHILFSGYLNSNLRVHIHDLLVSTRDVDPHNDQINRYVVILYKFNSERKQVVPTREYASSTLRGANELAKKLSEQTGYKVAKFNLPGAEYILIRFISTGEDFVRSMSRHNGRRKHA